MRLSRGGTARQLCPQSFNAGGSNRLLDGHRVWSGEKGDRGVQGHG